MDIHQEVLSIKEKASTLTERLPISPDSVKAAIKARRIEPTTKEDVFYLMAALFLLNTAIKMPEYKKQLTYAGIKVPINTLISQLCSWDRRLVDDIWIDTTKGNKALVTVFGLRFVFFVISTPAIDYFILSSDNQVKATEDFNLEYVSEELFCLAKKYREWVKSGQDEE